MPPQLTFTKAASEISTAARAIAYGAKVNFFGLALSGKDMIDQESNLKKQERDKAVALAEELPDIYYGIIDHLQNAVKEKEFRLVVFIDDLDRCIPEKAVEMLEAIKLFLDLEGYLFILGVDRKLVEEGILTINMPTILQSQSPCIVLRIFADGEPASSHHQMHFIACQPSLSGKRRLAEL